MSRLLDRFVARTMLSGDNPGPGYVGGYYNGSQLLTTTYGKSAGEPILPVFRSYAEAGYAGNAVVFGVILARLNLFSEATFKFRDLTTKRLYGTQDLLPLEEPWPGATTGELLARMEQDASLAGNAFIARKPTQLERWRPDCVSIISSRVDPAGRVVPPGTPDSVRVVVGYLHSPNNGVVDDQTEFLPVEDVVHWSPIPDPLAQWRGMSWLTPVLREINSDIAMTRHKQAFFENAATPNLLIKYQGRLAPGKAEQIRAAFESKHQGPEHAWGTAVLDEAADLTVVGRDFQQMDFTSVQAAGENRIAVAGGVPGIIVGLKEGLQAATYSNYQQAMRRMADLFGRPQWRSACASLAKLVTIPAGAQLWYDTSDIAALREGEQARAETIQTLSIAAQQLISSGYEPDSVTNALTAGDLTLLKHTGAIPTALYPEGKDPTKAKGTSP